jgi:hypothetical protein
MKKSALLSLSLFLALGLATSACGKKDAAAAGGSGKSKVVKIDGLKLQVDGPEDAVVDDMSMGSAPSFMVRGDGLVITVGEVNSGSPTTFEAALEESKIYEGSTYTKQEKTADGWHLEFNNKGSMGANYFVEIRRTLGGRPITCNTTAPTPEMAASAVKACGNLRPL